MKKAAKISENNILGLVLVPFLFRCSARTRILWLHAVKPKGEAKDI